MSRTHRRTSYFMFRSPKTFNELRQSANDYQDTEYHVSARHRYIPTLFDDIRISANKELDHH